MKTISIQAEYGHHDDFDKLVLLQKLDELDIVYEAEESPEGVNVYISTDNVDYIWQKIESILLASSCISNSCAVIVEGKKGWDDLLFLHSNE